MANISKADATASEKIMVAAGIAEHLGPDGLVASVRTLIMGGVALAALEMQRSVLVPTGGPKAPQNTADAIYKLSKSMAAMTQSVARLPGEFQTGPGATDFQALADHLGEAAERSAGPDGDDLSGMDPVSELERRILARAGIGNDGASGQ